MDKKLILGVVIVAVLIVFAGLSLSQSTGTTNKKTVVDSGNRTVKEFTMQSYTEIINGKYYPKFSPKEISVKKGDLVRIKITDTMGIHDFKIDELGVYADTPLNQEVVVEFVADKVGSFTYYCTKPGHRQNGHWGTLVVTE